MPKAFDINQDFLGRLVAVECPDATYRAKAPALVMHRAAGSNIWDVAGRQYVDLCAGFGALPHGHNAPSLKRVFALHVAADAEPIEHGMGDVYPSRSKIELLEFLNQVVGRSAPFLNKTALALTGSQAVELALKTAMLKTRRPNFISFDGSYHGVDLGVLPVTWRKDFRDPFSQYASLSRGTSLPFNCSLELVKETGHALATAGGVAAIIVEPIQGRAGTILPNSGWLAGLRKAADDLGALLIFDEIFVGLGRCGIWTFADQGPCDLLCLGKALGNGMPLSACMGTDEAMGAWPESTGEAIHTGTFFGHPLSCAVGLEGLRDMVEQNLPARAAELGKSVQALLTHLAVEKKFPGAIRGQGLMITIDGMVDGWGARAMDRLRTDGIIALASGAGGRCLSLSPSLNIDEALLLSSVRTIAHRLFN